MHDGELTASSGGVGHGSVFTLALPAEREDTRVVAEAREPIERSDKKANLDILVIEDNQDVADLLAIWLESRGYTPHVANTGQVGLELIQRVRPSVVLCDIGLPGMDGNEVCRRVATLPFDDKPVMIALSGWGMEEDRNRTREAGFAHHLVKPVAPQALFELLDSMGYAEASAPLP